MRPASLSAGIRTKFEVALERSRLPESNWRLAGITAAYLLTAPSQQLADMPAPAAQRGGRLLEGAAREPGQEEASERGPPLLHVVRPRTASGSTTPRASYLQLLRGQRAFFELFIIGNEPTTTGCSAPFLLKFDFLLYLGRGKQVAVRSSTSLGCALGTQTSTENRFS